MRVRLKLGLYKAVGSSRGASMPEIGNNTPLERCLIQNGLTKCIKSALNADFRVLRTVLERQSVDIKTIGTSKLQ